MKFFDKTPKEESALVTTTQKNGLFQIEIHHSAVLDHLNKAIPNGNLHSKSNEALRDLFDKNPILEALLDEIRTMPTSENKNGKTTFHLKKEKAEKLIEELKAVGLSAEYQPRRGLSVETDPQEHARTIYHTVKTTLALELSDQLFATMSSAMSPKFSR